MKKFIMLIAMALTLCATNKAVAHDFAAVNADGDTIWYNIKEETSEVEVTFKDFDVDISEYEGSYTGTINIPSTVTYEGVTYSVAFIGRHAFSYSSSLISVTIPSSVRIIRMSAFLGCSGLTSVTIPNSVTSIEESAFSGCSGLTSVTIPNYVMSIGDYAFSGCSGLTSVTIPNSVMSIGDYAFSDCSGLTSVTIPNYVTSIECGTFYGCIYNHRTTKTNQKYPSVNL